MAFADLVEHPAKGVFAVCCSDRVIEFQRPGFHAFQFSIMRERPVPAPEFPGKGVGVFQANPAMGRLADMANDVTAFDGVGFDKVR